MTEPQDSVQPLPAFPWVRLLVWTTALIAPSVLALAVLVGLRRLAGIDAVLALGAIALGTAGLAWFVLAGVTALRGYLDTVGQDAEPEAPPFSAAVVSDLAAAVARSHRQLSKTIEELERQAEAGEFVLDHIPAPLVLVDRGLTVVGANRAARKLLGRSIINRALSAVVRDPVFLAAAERVRARLGGQEAEFMLGSPVEQAFHARLTPLPPTRADGAAILVVLQDVTAARRIDEMRSDFIANVSHELRTPLSAIIGFIETLQGPARDDATARERFLAIMREEAERMARLVRDLMSLSRIEMREHAPPTEAIDVARIAQLVVEAMRIRAGEKSVRLRLDLPNGPVWVTGDADELTQVLQNLVDNAIKYSPDAKTVRVQVRDGVAQAASADAAMRRRSDSPGQVRIVVSNKGEGIAPDHLSRLTERFYRVDAARSRTMGGTGLGLAIVKHIVNRHGGRLEIESAPGKGSAFAVALPAALGPPALKSA